MDAAVLLPPFCVKTMDTSSSEIGLSAASLIGSFVISKTELLSVTMPSVMVGANLSFKESIMPPSAARESPYLLNTELASEAI